MSMPIEFRLNGEMVRVQSAPNQTLHELLRTQLGLAGTKHACTEGNCGACTVLLDGLPVYSCIVLAVEVDGATVDTVEGMEDEELHPLQRALIDQHGLQNSRPKKNQIRYALAGNLCRCTGYTDIIKAIQVASRARR